MKLTGELKYMEPKWCSVGKVFLEISENSQENACANFLRTFSYRKPLMAASDLRRVMRK